MRKEDFCEMDNGKIFNRALNNISIEFAGRAAIRRMFDMEMTISDIRRELLYPLSEDVIKNEIWSYLLENRTVLLNEPDYSAGKRYDFIEETNEYGRKSFKRIEMAPSDHDIPEYIKTGFGVLKYKDPDGLSKRIMELALCDREYITELPWPLGYIWHKKNERIKRIYAALGE